MDDKDIVAGLTACSSESPCENCPFKAYSSKERIGKTCADYMMKLAAQRIMELSEVSRDGLLYAV